MKLTYNLMIGKGFFENLIFLYSTIEQTVKNVVKIKLRPFFKFKANSFHFDYD